MKDRLRILLVEETDADVAVIHQELRNAGLVVDSKWVHSREAFLSELADHPPDLILSDHGIPSFDAVTALALARFRCPHIPFIFIASSLREEEAMQCVRCGAHAFVLKTELEATLVPAVRRALDETEGFGRGRAEARETEDWFRRMIELCPEAMLVHCGLRVVFINPAGLKLLGAEAPEQWIGRTIRDLVHPGDWKRAKPHLAAPWEAQAGDPRVEQRWVRLDGSVVEVEVSAACLTGDNRPFVQVVARELAGRQQAARAGVEEKLQRRQVAALEERVARTQAQLQIANRELEMFGYSVSHDLRAPLRHIDGFLRMLQQRLVGQLDETSREYFNVISDSAQHMGQLMDALLAFSRMGRAEMCPTLVRLDQVVKGVLDDLCYEVEGRNIEWVIGPLPVVQGDRTLLRQVLFNLISNALKYTRPRNPARIELACCSTSQEFVISVRDNGVGFEMEWADRLFGIFQRLHRQADFEGVGIGLANVRRIVQRHGGRTWAEGMPDAGATFYFSLPRSGEAE